MLACLRLRRRGDDMGLEIAVVIIDICLLSVLWVGLRDGDPVFGISSNPFSGARPRQAEKTSALLTIS